MKLVFTNGCFDILHGGHISFLRYARSLGDSLIVGLNSDESIRRIKGPTRPIQNQITRSKILLELKSVSNVILFNEDTPEELIKYIKPDILVKGPEAAKTIIPGAGFVKSYGGKVIVPSWNICESTTAIIQKILDTHE